MFYRISEFAELVGVSTSTLRNWERTGILLPHHKTPTGYRYYSDEQLNVVFNNFQNGEKTVEDRNI